MMMWCSNNLDALAGVGLREFVPPDGQRHSGFCQFWHLFLTFREKVVRIDIGSSVVMDLVTSQAIFSEAVSVFHAKNHAPLRQRP